MLKTRSWIKLGLGLILLLFLLFVALLAWPKAPPTPEEIAKRGLQAPAERASAWNGAFGAAQDWFDQGWDALASWDKSAIGIQGSWFSKHLSELKRSKNPKDQEEYRRLLDLARKWHENLLSRYPELRVAYRNVPDDRNALKLLSALQKRLSGEDGNNGFHPSDNFREMLNHKKPWDPEAAQAWLDANRAVVDELRTICLMPESSIKGLGMDDFGNLPWDGYRAFLIDARLAAERGDLAASIESVRAAVSLANHLLGSEAPTLFQNTVGNAILSQTRNAAFESILPSIPADQIDLATWKGLLRPNVQVPADFAGMMKGDWNVVMQQYLLPAFVDPEESHSPSDADKMIEAYTNHVSLTVQFNTPLVLTDLPSHPCPGFDSSGLSWRSRKMTESITQFPYRDSWEIQQINTGLTQAAFDILQGQPVPNDPIHGQPYTWNPETRELSLPKGPEFSRMPSSPIKLPKL